MSNKNYFSTTTTSSYLHLVIYEWESIVLMSLKSENNVFSGSFRYMVIYSQHNSETDTSSILNSIFWIYLHDKEMMLENFLFRLVIKDCGNKLWEYFELIS